VMKKVPGRDALVGDRHMAIVTAGASGAKAPCLGDGCGTAEAVPLSKAFELRSNAQSCDETA